MRRCDADLHNLCAAASPRSGGNVEIFDSMTTFFLN